VSDERKQLGSRLPKALVVKLGKVALDRDVSLNDIVEGALVDWFNMQEEQAVYGLETKSEGAAKATPLATPSEQSTPKSEEKKGASKTPEKAEVSVPLVKPSKVGAKKK
jgi:hypothetical protein